MDCTFSIHPKTMQKEWKSIEIELYNQRTFSLFQTHKSFTLSLSLWLPIKRANVDSLRSSPSPPCCRRLRAAAQGFLRFESIDIGRGFPCSSIGWSIVSLLRHLIVYIQLYVYLCVFVLRSLWSTMRYVCCDEFCCFRRICMSRSASDEWWLLVSFWRRNEFDFYRVW